MWTSTAVCGVECEYGQLHKKAYKYQYGLATDPVTTSRHFLLPGCSEFFLEKVLPNEQNICTNYSSVINFWQPLTRFLSYQVYVSLYFHLLQQPLSISYSQSTNTINHHPQCGLWGFLFSQGAIYLIDTLHGNELFFVRPAWAILLVQFWWLHGLDAGNLILLVC